MSTILALSDTHLSGPLPDGNYYPEQLIYLINQADLVLHAGDIVCQNAYNNLVELCEDARCKLWAIQGNSSPIIIDSKNQPLKKQKADMELGIKIGLMHDDANIGYVFSETYLADKAASMVSDDTKFKGVDVLVFGHLHEPIISWSKDSIGKRRLLVCPGPGSNNVNALIHKCSPDPTVALLDIIGGNISCAEIIRISWPK